MSAGLLDGEEDDGNTGTMYWCCGDIQNVCKALVTLDSHVTHEYTNVKGEAWPICPVSTIFLGVLWEFRKSLEGVWHELYKSWYRNHMRSAGATQEQSGAILESPRSDSQALALIEDSKHV